MLQRLRNSRKDEQGFTLIELLVVILIIAILAAIAIPVFLRQREKGYVADVQSTLKNLATAAESWGTLKGGNYTGISATVLSTEEDAKWPTTQNTPTVAAVDGAKGYCITVTDTRLSGHAWGTATYYSKIGKPTEADTCAGAGA